MKNFDLSEINTCCTRNISWSTQQKYCGARLLCRIWHNSACGYFINRYKGKHKYILVEQGEYFDTVLKPRIQKVVYSADWKDGKATAPQTGISHAFKVLKLESYEDTLNNLQLRRSEAQQTCSTPCRNQLKKIICCAICWTSKAVARYYRWNSSTSHLIAS